MSERMASYIAFGGAVHDSEAGREITRGGAEEIAEQLRTAVKLDRGGS